MGNNIDLVEFMGLPETVTCPQCKREMRSRFDDYDIECGDPNEKDGWMHFDCYCHTCEHNWQYEVFVSA